MDCKANAIDTRPRAPRASSVPELARARSYPGGSPVWVGTQYAGPNYWNHLNVPGQAAEAELIWPVVVSLLGL